MSTDSGDKGTASIRSATFLTAEERRQLRQKRRASSAAESDNQSKPSEIAQPDGTQDDSRFAFLLARNEDSLLEFVANVNKVYQELLKKPAPFMTFVFCGMQSAGKSTIMERFLNAVLNIVQEGTGTRCPLDTTCIHDSSCTEPSCDLWGEELPDGKGGQGLSVEDVFSRITDHNKKLGDEDCFSTKPLVLHFRSSSVQNMRFIDTPGIIANKSTGADNREGIKKILQSEMLKDNTKLCVLLQPSEFASNPIIDFIDDSLGGRDAWIDDATFLMTKFDMKLHDSRTGSKANNFFKEFLDNKIAPHLVITPTLSKEDHPTEKLFIERKQLLAEADGYERDKFKEWRRCHAKFQTEPGGDEVLNMQIEKRIGFWSAKKVMREIMLKDTIERLPEVLTSLKADLDHCVKEQKELKEKQKFTDPNNLRFVVTKLLHSIEERILSYLDGNLEISKKFPHELQTLDDEIECEEDSDWVTKELTYHSEKEDGWRDRIASLEEFPDYISSEDAFLGGKQVHRAINFYFAMMIESLPDTEKLKELVANATGYLNGGLERENWERAMVEVTRLSLKEVSDPGLNYLIKHIGCIFRRLFPIAINDLKQGEELSANLRLLPSSVERYLVGEFDEMLWGLLENVAKQTHASLEPMYYTIDTTLPTFHAENNDSGQDVDEETADMTWVQSLRSKLESTGAAAKEYLRSESKKRATAKKCFLSDERASMITKEEIDKIIKISNRYIYGLMQLNHILLKNHINYYLYKAFKDAIKRDLPSRIEGVDWNEMIQEDPYVESRLKELESQIAGLKNSLRDVQRMQQKM